MNDTRPDVRSHLVKKSKSEEKIIWTIKRELLSDWVIAISTSFSAESDFFVNQKVKKLAAKTNFFLDRWKQNLG